MAEVDGHATKLPNGVCIVHVQLTAPSKLRIDVTGTKATKKIVRSIGARPVEMIVVERKAVELVLSHSDEKRRYY